MKGKTSAIICAKKAKIQTTGQAKGGCDSEEKTRERGSTVGGVRRGAGLRALARGEIHNGYGRPIGKCNVEPRGGYGSRI